MGIPGPPKGTPAHPNTKPHLWKKGQSGNPRGHNSTSAKRIQKNAAKATELREKFLSTLESRIATIEVMAEDEFANDPSSAEREKSSRIMALLDADINRLMTDSENRGYGAPKQPVDLTKRTVAADDMDDDELAAIAADEDAEQE
jgi:hypothetical protein